MMEKIERIKEKEAVSEIIGTVLLLAIAVIIFSSLIVYVLSMDTSSSAPSVHMVGSMDETAVATVENRGGDSIPVDDLKVVVRKGNNQTHTFSGNALADVFHDTNDNDRWDVGDYITVNCSKIFSGNIARWQISVAVIDQPSNAIIMSGVLQQGVLHTMPPVAQFTYNPFDPKTQETLFFNATESYDPDGGSIVEYRWDWTNDGTVDISTPSPTSTHKYPEGSYNVTLTVVDDEGETNTTSTAYSHGGVNIPPPVVVTGNVLPESNFTWSVNPNVNGTIDFTSNVSDPDGEIVSYKWEFGDGTSSTTPNPSNTYASGGNYTATLMVTDDNGDSSTKVVTVEVPNIRPQATFSTSSANITTAASVTFDGSTSHDKDGTIQSYNWQFGDGDTASGVSVSHQYTTPGNYTVTLNVTDNNGDWDTLQKNITVSAPATAESPKFLFVDNTPTDSPPGPWSGGSGIDNILDACQNIMGSAEYSWGKAIDQWTFVNDSALGHGPPYYSSPDMWGKNIRDTVLNEFDIVIWSTGNFPGDGSDASYDGNDNTWNTPLTEGSDDTSDHVYEIAEHITGNESAGTFLMTGTYAARDLQDYDRNWINEHERWLGNVLGLIEDTGGINYNQEDVPYSGRLSEDDFEVAPYHAQGSVIGVDNTSSYSTQYGLATLNITSPIDMYTLFKQDDPLFRDSLVSDNLIGSTDETTVFEDKFWSDKGWTTGGTNNEWQRSWQSSSEPPYRQSWLYGTDVTYGHPKRFGNIEYRNNANCYVESPSIDLSGYSSAALQFKDWYTFGDVGDNVELEVYNGNWHSLATFDGTDPGSLSIHTYDLSDYVGGNIQLRWTLTTNGNNVDYGYYFDNVEVTATTTDSVTGSFAIDATRGQNRSIILGFDLNADGITDESRENYLKNMLLWLGEGAGYTTEVWVNNNPPEGWLDDDAHLDTIQAGIDAVPPGGTVNVIGSDGQVYNERLIIGKSVDLIGVDQPTIQASGDSVVTMQADWTTMKNFTIKGNTAQNGILLDGATRCSIINSTLTTNIADKCISLDNAHNNTIRGCTLRNASYGIRASYSLGTKIVNNDIQSHDQAGISLRRASLASITNNLIRHTGGAIHLENLEACTITYNTIADNSGTAIKLVSAADHNTVQHNTIDNNTRGLHFDISNSNIVTDNVITNHSDTGIYLINSSHSNTIHDNTIRSNTNGIQFQSSSNSYIRYNEIEDNQYGIRCTESGFHVIQGNQVNNNTERGIYLSASSDYNVLYNNTVHNNSQGIYISNSKNNTIERCTISNSTTDGIYLDQALYNLPGGNVVLNNTITANGRHGIYMQSSNENEVTQNDIYGNGQSGIRLYSFSNTNAIYNNTLWENSYGVYVEGSNYNNLTENAINNSSDAGIYLNNGAQENIIVDNLIRQTGNGLKMQSSPGNNITANVICWNQGYGIWSTSSSNSRIADNYLHNNTQTGLLIISGDSNDVLSNTVEHNDIGIHLSSSEGNGNNIEDNLVRASTSHGIFLENSRPAGNNEVINNTVHDNGGNGVHLYTSKGNSIQDNRLYSNQRGISLQSSNSNSVFNNTVYANAYGIYLSSSTANTIGSNTEGGNRLYGHTDTGIYLCLSSDNNIIDNNTLWENTQGIALSNSDNADIKNNHLYWHNSSAAIKVVSSALGSSFPIRNNRVDNNSIGIEIRSSNGTHVESGNIISDNERGIYIVTSGSCIISGNTLSSNTDEGIYMYASTYQHINGNVVSNSTYGIYLNASTTSSEEGIHDNLLEYNDRGIYINDTASGNLIKENTFTIAPSHYGVYIIGSNCTDNEIYSNNFENTSYRDTGLCYDDGGGNSWYDEQHPDTVGGNYWANYEARYPGEDDSGKFWPVYYEIAPDTDEDDFRPLVEPV